MRWVIPKWIRLPFGYKVLVKLLTDAQWEKQHPKDTDAHALWIDTSHTIYLRNNRTPKQQREDLAHELIHVVLDWQRAVLDGDAIYLKKK